MTNEFYVVNTTYPTNPYEYNKALGAVVAQSMNILPQGSAAVVLTYTATRRRLWYGGNESLFATYVQTRALVPVLQVPDVLPCTAGSIKSECGRKDLDAVAAYVSDRLIASILSFDATLRFRKELDQRGSKYFRFIEIVLELPVQEAQILALSAVSSKGFDFLMILYALLGLLLLCCGSIFLFKCRSMPEKDVEEEVVELDKFAYNDDDDDDDK